MDKPWDLRERTMQFALGQLTKALRQEADELTAIFTQGTKTAEARLAKETAEAQRAKQQEKEKNRS